MISSVFAQGLSASLIAGLFTCVGGFMIFLKRNYSQENINLMLNVAAGVMLAAAFFSLLVPAISGITSMSIGKYWGALLLVFSVLSGMGLVWILHAILPHEHKISAHCEPQMRLRSSWLFVIAIAIHKFPEGLAVGVAYAGEHLYNPDSLTVGIGVQNIPEGLMVAVTLMAVGFSRLKSALFASATGLVQPLGALIGVIGTGWSMNFIPFGMAVAGGTLLFVVINEILPETYTNKENKKYTAAVMLGFLFMTYLTMILE